MTLEIKENIYSRINKDKNSFKLFFKESNKDFGARYCVIDNLLPLSLANEIAENFPDFKKMRYLNSFREQKYTSKDFKFFKEIINNISLAFHDKQIINLISEITSIKNAESDDSFYAGGISAMSYGNFLNPHLDNSHNYNISHYRVLNLLYYVTPDWKIEDGANLELWDEKVLRNKIIESKFNRLVLMETNNKSWHSVSKSVNKFKSRNCVSNYYFSKYSISGRNYNNVTKFSGRPEQKFIRFYCTIDNCLRQFLRIFNKKGFSKVDLNKKIS